MASVTKSQARVLEFIRNFIEKRQYSPTFQEIAEGLGLRSLATVSKHIAHLKEKGLLKDSFNRARSLEVVEPGSLESRCVLNAAGTHLRDNVENCWWVREIVMAGKPKRRPNERRQSYRLRCVEAELTRRKENEIELIDKVQNAIWEIHNRLEEGISEELVRYYRAEPGTEYDRTARKRGK